MSLCTVYAILKVRVYTVLNVLICGIPVYLSGRVSSSFSYIPVVRIVAPKGPSSPTSQRVSREDNHACWWVERERAPLCMYPTHSYGTGGKYTSWHVALLKRRRRRIELAIIIITITSLPTHKCLRERERLLPHRNNEFGVAKKRQINLLESLHFFVLFRSGTV